ncbi:MAG: YcaO-like family protein, partial [Caulobacteraceae bacterium]
ISDFSSTRDLAPDADEPLAWVEARKLDGEGPLWVPFDVVSLDLCRRGHPRLERGSNGVGARFDLDGAIVKALLEIIERDADNAWRAAPIHGRSLTRMDLASVPFPWFGELREKIEGAGLRLSIFHQRAVVPVACFRCEMVEPDAGGDLRGRIFGTACHPRPEDALLGAVLEAIQSRLAAISGARDDVPFPDPAQPHREAVGSGLPLPQTIEARPWRAVESAFPPGADWSSAEIGRLLASAGYPDAAYVDLSRPEREAFVVKALAPGLGALGRDRRRPCLPP